MTEASLHRAVAAFLRVALKPPTIWTTIGHGGGGRVRGAQLKAMGVQKGWPDILILHNPADGLGHFGAGPVVVGIELKAAKGVLSPEQKSVKDAFAKVRSQYAVARTVEHVEVILRQNDIPLHATTLRKAA